MTEDEMVEWHQWPDGHEFENAPGDSEGQGSLACCSHWGCKKVRHDLATEQQNYLNCCLKILPCFCCHQNLGFLCPQKLNKKYGGNREVTLILSWQKEDIAGPCLKSCVPPTHRKSRVFYKMRASSQGLATYNVIRILYCCSCFVSKTAIGWGQVAW